MGEEMAGPVGCGVVPDPFPSRKNACGGPLAGARQDRRRVGYGEVITTVGASVSGLRTSTRTGVDVPTLPAASRASAVRV